MKKSKISLHQNSCEFLHEDFSWGRKLLVYKRGDGRDMLVIVANFSDQFLGGYFIHNWPKQEGQWFEITQKRTVSSEYIRPGYYKEDIYPFEAKSF